MLRDIFDSLLEAILEITGVFLFYILLIDKLNFLSSVVDLGNAYNAGQITVYQYLLQIIFELAKPSIFSIIVGWIIHQVRKALSH